MRISLCSRYTQNEHKWESIVNEQISAASLYDRVARVIPKAEWMGFQDDVEAILELKRKRNAVMAETAKLLNPGKTVLIPDMAAGCSLADSITPEDIALLRKAYPGVPVVTYVNTSAAVKAASDICCTSGNARQVVESLGVPRVLMLPDIDRRRPYRQLVTKRCYQSLTGHHSILLSTC